ncbi:MAG: hypothetical protein U0528_11375 [Anaerolineae bacterium]
MAAFALTLILFIFWLVLGYAVAYTLNARSDVLQNALLAPVVGIAVTLLPMFWLNRLGLPIERFATVWLMTLILLTAILWWWRRPIVPLKKYLPFALILIAALLVIGQPLLYFGFEWRSYGNDDMANYVLRAARLLHYGFYDAPTIDGLRYDYSQIFWFMDVPSNSRAGVDMLLAWVVGVIGAPLNVDTLQAFMPVAIVFHLALLSASGALIYSYRRYRMAAVVGTALLAVSAMTMLGTLYQLFAQVLGVALMVGCSVLLLRPLYSIAVRPRVTLRYGILLAIMLAAFWLVYPEITPFFVIAFGLYVLLGLIRRWWSLSWKQNLLNFVPVIALTLIFLNTYLLNYVLYLLQQTAAGINTGNNSIFPYFLQPTGFANLWGLQSISRLPAEPWLSLTIIAGGLLLTIVCGASLWLAWRGYPTASISVVMLAFAALLFIRQSGFGLFKLAMFSQPFLVGTITVFCLIYLRRISQRLRLALLILLGISGLPAISSYTNSSWGQTSEFVALYNISNLNMNTKLDALIQAKNPTLIISDALNSVSGKFQALDTAGIPTSFLNQPLFWYLLPRGRDTKGSPCPPDEQFVPNYAQCRIIYNAIYDQLKTYEFDHHDPQNPTAQSSFYVFQPDLEAQQAMAQTKDAYWLIGTTQLTILNRSHFATQASDPVMLLSDNEAKDVLIYIYSLASGELRSFRSSFGSLLPDYFYPGSSVQGLKRYLLLRAINLSPASRLVLNMTTTIRGDGNATLPLASVVGDQRYPFQVVGRGSARLFSPPLKAQSFDGLEYLLVDLGSDLTDEFLPPAQSGIMRLFGTNINRFSGLSLAYLRDLSLMAEEEYARLVAPTSLSKFPQDLDNPALEYSGVYEDGWLSEAAFFGLEKSSNAGDLVVSGLVPQIGDPNFSTTLRLLVDDVELANSTLQTGEFEVRVSSASIVAGRHRVELQFSAVQKLPGGDRRPAAAVLKMVGFEEG